MAKEESLQHYIKTRALADMATNRSVSAYNRATRYFVSWAKEKGVKKPSAVSQEVLQAYSDSLVERGYTASSVHTYLAPICKAFGINMKDIRKPKRITAHNIRGRAVTDRGLREEMDTRYVRSVELQRIIGIRRAELGHLKGADIATDGSYVIVRRGKGGKKQEQHVLPQDRERLLQICAGVTPDALVLSPEEIAPHANYHHMRADQAKRAYTYYLHALQTGRIKREELIKQLRMTWLRGHLDDFETVVIDGKLKVDMLKSSERSRGRLKAFVASMDGQPYKLRGESAKRAKELGYPAEYDRVALMAVSVWHLSHWRLDVTVSNYMIA